jgi:hypothetical protein
MKQERIGERLKWLNAALNKDAAPQVMIEALVFSLRERGTAALAEPNAQHRIGAISEQQLHEVCGRLKWPEADIERLVEQWTKDHG